MRQSIKHIALGVVGLVFLQSCSLALDFDECSETSECGGVGQCVAGLCQEPEYVEVTDYIVENTTWTADKIYRLKNLVFVIAPATLTIEAGTTILGEKDGALVTQAGARIEAVGTREAPIVFTSAQPLGRRRAGDWGGLALIGKAPVNRPNMTLRIRDDEDVDRVGGSDDTWNCGTLKYVRSEFGGGLVNGQKALNGITFAGCGSETTVDYIQAHLGDDDGIEIFGGTMDIRHAVSSRPQGDGFDIDVGWRGTGQFLAVQMDVNGEEALEIENIADDPTLEPQTDFQLYNFTIIGAEQDATTQRGVLVKSGGLAELSHGIVMGTGAGALHIAGAHSGVHAENGEIELRNTLMYQTGADGTGYFELDEEAAQAAPTFDPAAFYGAEERNNVFGSDPNFERPYDLGNPGWVPSLDSVAGVEPPPAPFDPTAVYRGAFSPSSPAWTEGWTAYPKN